MDAERLAKSIGAIAACVAALIALWNLLKEIANIIRERLRKKSARLENGRWEGNHPDGLFDHWDFTGELSLEKQDTSSKIPVSGRIHWKLKDCSPTFALFPRRGEDAFEVVEGELKDGILTLTGVKLIGKPPDLVELSKHTISIGNGFQGTSCSKRGGKCLGHMQGNIHFSRKPIFINE